MAAPHEAKLSAGALLQKLIAFSAAPAQLTDDEVELIDKERNNVMHRQYVRGTLASLSRSADKLMDAVKSDREAAVALMQLAMGAEAEATLFCHLAQMMAHASDRIRLSITVRDDSDDVVKEAGRQYDGPGVMPAYFRKEGVL